MPEYIEEERFDKFLDDAVPKLCFKELNRNCPNCNHTIRDPLVVSESDRMAMLLLIKLANEYLTERGVTERMLTTIMKKCKLHQRFNELRTHITPNQRTPTRK